MNPASPVPDGVPGGDPSLGLSFLICTILLEGQERRGCAKRLAQDQVVLERRAASPCPGEGPRDAPMTLSGQLPTCLGRAPQTAELGSPSPFPFLCPPPPGLSQKSRARGRGRVYRAGWGQKQFLSPEGVRQETLAPKGASPRQVHSTPMMTPKLNLCLN